MTAKRKLGTKEFALIFSVANLILFLMYFVPYYVIEVKEVNQAYEYFRAYIYEIVALWLLPIATATVLLVRCGQESIKKTLVTALLLSLPNLCYTVPIYYLLGIEYGGDSIESLGFLLLVSAVYILIFFASVIALFYIIKRSLVFFTAKEMINTLPQQQKSNLTRAAWQGYINKSKSAFAEKLNEGKPFDFSHPTSLAFLFAALAEFAVYFIRELYTTVSYLINYAGGYQPAEIAYMIFRFVFILIMLFVLVAVADVVKGRTKPADNEQETE